MYQQTACCCLLSARRTARNDTFAAGEGTIESRGGSGGGPGEGCTASRKHLAGDIAPGCTVPINCLMPRALGSCCLGGGVGVPPGLLAARQPRRRRSPTQGVRKPYYTSTAPRRSGASCNASPTNAPGIHMQFLPNERTQQLLSWDAVFVRFPLQVRQLPR